MVHVSTQNLAETQKFKVWLNAILWIAVQPCQNASVYTSIPNNNRSKVHQSDNFEVFWENNII